MKLRTQFCALAALLVGFSACKKDEVVTPEGGATAGNTYASITISLDGKGSQARAGQDDFNKKEDWAGNDKVNTLDLYLVPATGAVVKHSFSADKKEFKTAGNKLTVPAFKVEAATGVTIYAVVNKSTNVATALDAKLTNKSEFETAWNSAVLLEGFAKIENDKDVILMTGKGKNTVTIEAGVSRDVANNKTKNFFSLDIMRVAARVVATFKGATTTDPTMDVKVGVNKIGVLSAMNWTVLQYDAKFFIGQKMVGSDVQSFAWDKNATWANTRTDYATYYDTAEASKWITLGVSKKAATDLGVTGNYTPKFITETLHAPDQYKKGNTAYILVKGTFTPEASICHNGVIPVKNTTFWYGYDGKVYDQEADAKTANGENRFVKYTDGVAYYIVFINPDPTVKQSPIYRNNFYHVDVVAINGLGFSGDPLNNDSNNPNKPDPNDPNVPGKPSEDLKAAKTYMSAEVSVLNWTFHSYDATLDPND